MDWLSVLFPFLVVLVIAGKSEATDLPACTFPEAQVRKDKVSVLIGKDVNSPEVLCVRILNETKSPIKNGIGDIKLERNWLGVMWSARLHFREFFSFRRGFTKDALITTRPGEVKDIYLPSSRDPIPKGKYRVCLRYHFTSGEEEQGTVYSEEIFVP